MKHIHQLSPLDRPREKVKSKGAISLSDVELIATILGKGHKNKNLFKLSFDVLKLIHQHQQQLTFDILMKIEGIGSAKAAQILAVLEFSRRRHTPEHLKIKHAKDIFPILRPFAYHKQEQLICFSLNGAFELIHYRTITIGLSDQTLIHPREVFADPLQDRASYIILAHNHPSNELQPSRDDIEITNKLKQIGTLLGIELLDHIIFNTHTFFSILDDQVHCQNDITQI